MSIVCGSVQLPKMVEFISRGRKFKFGMQLVLYDICIFIEHHVKYGC